MGKRLLRVWLAQFIKVTKNKKVTPITYGNPSGFWANEIMADQIEYLNAIGKIRLETLLRRPVEEVSSTEVVKQKFNKASLSVLKYSQRQINLLSTLLEKKQLEDNQLRLSQLLNPDLEEKIFLDLLKDYDKSISTMRKKLNIKNTKFTVTSSKEELPITVVNDFDQIVKLKLSSRAMNSKVSVAQIEEIELAKENQKSRCYFQLRSLLQVIQGCWCNLLILKISRVGYPVNINLKLSVISPVTTWITTTAAVLLIVAALVQSVRRVRRRS